MKINFEVIDAKPYHVGQIIRLMRRTHREALAGIGLDKRDIHKELNLLFRESAFRKAWMGDGKLMALGGVTGSLLDPHGFVWLALAEEVLKFPSEIIKEARRQLAGIMSTKTELATTVLGADEVALRFAVHLGFHADHLPRDRAAAVKDLQENPDRRLPAGDSFAVMLGYHGHGGVECAPQQQL